MMDQETLQSMYDEWKRQNRAYENEKGKIEKMLKEQEDKHVREKALIRQRHTKRCLEIERGGVEAVRADIIAVAIGIGIAGLSLVGMSYGAFSAYKALTSTNINPIAIIHHV